jgi:hypothetical protein
MNSYKTASQATGVARTLSRSAGCTILVYQAADSRFITARPSDAVSGLVIGVYQNGYKLQSGGQRA